MVINRVALCGPIFVPLPYGVIPMISNFYSSAKVRKQTLNEMFSTMHPLVKSLLCYHFSTSESRLSHKPEAAALVFLSELLNQELVPSEYIKAYDEGAVYTFSKRIEPFGLPLIKFDKLATAAPSPVCFIESLASISANTEKAKKRMEMVTAADATVVNPSDVITNTVLNWDLTEEDFASVVSFLSNAQGSLVATMKGLPALTIRNNEGVYSLVSSYGVGTKEYKLRNYYHHTKLPCFADGEVSDMGAIIPSKYTIWTLQLLSFLPLQKFEPKTAKKMFDAAMEVISDLSVEEASVGWSCPLHNHVVSNKIAGICFEGSLANINTSSDNVAAMKDYYLAGYNLLMHKVLKYVSVAGDAMLMSRIGDTFKLAMTVDKGPKIGQRLNLFSIETAAKATSGDIEVDGGFFLDRHPISALTSEGQMIEGLGVRIPVCVYDHPLIAGVGGSGQAVAHPEWAASQSFVQKRVVKKELKLETYKSNAVKLIQLISEGEMVKCGQPLVWENGVPVLTHASVYDAKILRASKRENLDTNNVEVTIMMAEIVKGGDQKIRGWNHTKATYLSGLEAIRNFLIHSKEGEVVFDASTPYADNKAAVAYTFAEEAKTDMVLTEMAIAELGGATWLASEGRFDREEEIEAMKQTIRQTVTISINDIADNVWAYYVDSYNQLSEEQKRTVFMDYENQSMALLADAYIGECVYKVETPLTHTFCGRAAIAAEQMNALSLVGPAIKDLFLKSANENQKSALLAYRLATNTSVNCVKLSSNSVKIIFKDYVEGEPKVKLVYSAADGGYCLEATDKLAAIQFNNDSFTPAMAKALSYRLAKDGFDGIEFLNDAVDLAHQTKFNFDAKVIHTFGTRAFQCLQELMHEMSKRTGSNNFKQLMKRHATALKSCIDTMLADSGAPLKQACRTTKFAYTMRRRASIFTPADEAWISPESARHLGLVDGMTICPGRLPMPMLGNVTLKVVPSLGYGYMVLNPLTVAQIDNGDFDGDSMIFLAFAKRLVKTGRDTSEVKPFMAIPNSHLATANPIGDGLEVADAEEIECSKYYEDQGLTLSNGTEKWYPISEELWAEVHSLNESSLGMSDEGHSFGDFTITGKSIQKLLNGTRKEYTVEEMMETCEATYLTSFCIGGLFAMQSACTAAAMTNTSASEEQKQMMAHAIWYVALNMYEGDNSLGAAKKAISEKCHSFLFPVATYPTLSDTKRQEVASFKDLVAKHCATNPAKLMEAVMALLSAGYDSFSELPVFEQQFIAMSYIQTQAYKRYENAEDASVQQISPRANACGLVRRSSAGLLGAKHLDEVNYFVESFDKSIFGDAQYSTHFAWVSVIARQQLKLKRQLKNA